MQLAAVSATAVPGGALKTKRVKITKTLQPQQKQHWHPPSNLAQQRNTRSCCSKQHYKALRTRGSASVQQSNEFIDSRSAGDYVGTASLAAASSSLAYRHISYRNYRGTRPPPRRQMPICVTVLVPLPKQMDPSFSIKMRRHIAQRG